MHNLSFEMFVQQDKITRADWDRLLEKIGTYENNFSIEFSFNTNVVDFFIYSEKDLSILATKLDGFIFKSSGRLPLIESGQGIRFGISSKKNILEVREEEEFKKERVIKKVSVNIKNTLSFKTYSIKILLQDKFGNEFHSAYTTFTNPFSSFEFDFKNSPKMKKKSSPLALKFDEALKLFAPQTQSSIFEVFGFPYFSHPTFLSMEAFDSDKHGLVVGQTGVGKSKFIELFIKNIEKSSRKDEYAVVVIDPHANLFPQFKDLGKDVVNFDFIDNACNLFPVFSDPKIATELTILLFKTLLKDQFNAKMERVLKYTLYTMFLTNSMKLVSVKRFLTEIEFRKNILSNLGGEFGYLNQFFDTEFVELQTRFYDVSIMPVVVLIDELQFVPAFSKDPSGNLEDSLKNNFLTSFSLNRIYLGDKATRLISGLIIQQLFLLAQKKTINKKIILIIDEVALVENESLAYILSEARKFNLSLILSQQYLTQISPDLLKGILSNVYNYFVFKVSDEDAKIVAKNLDIAFPDDVLLRSKEKGISEEELKRNILVNLNPRECLVRLFSNGKFYPSFKAKTLNI